MNKNITKTIIQLFIILFISSCSLFAPFLEENPETGTLGLSLIASDSTRTVAPASISISSYTISFSNGPGTVPSVDTAEGNPSIDLPIGTWDINVDAKTAGSDIIASGSTSGVSITADTTTPVNITLNPLNTGTGDLTLMVQWPDSEGIDTIEVLLDSSAVDAGNYSQNSTEGTTTLTWSQSLAAGNYKGKINLKTGTVLRAQVNESIQIYGNLTSTKTITLSTNHFSQAPAAPSDLALTPAVGEIALAWTDNSVVETEYLIERKTGSGGSWSVIKNGLAANTITYTDTGLTQGLDYYYRVAALNSVGQSGYSAEANGSTTPTYSVTYDGNGADSGSVPTDGNSYPAGASVTVAGNTGSLVKDGYIYEGWNTQADGNGDDYAVGSTYTMGAGDVTLYGKWSVDVSALGINMISIISIGDVPVTCSLQEGTDNVTLTRPFMMSEMEVTQKQYEAVMGCSESWISTYGIGDNYPVYYANWREAAEFCNRLSTLDGKTAVYYSDAGFTDVYEASDEDTIYWKHDADGFRLPTESEWEYAASGASTGSETTYAGSDALDDVAWYSSNSESKSHEVGGKAANECGLYDMSGNLWEWTWDWYDSYDGGTDPSGALSGSGRVLRGGSWSISESYCAVSYRGYFDPSSEYNDYGFRIVQQIPRFTITYDANTADSGTVPAAQYQISGGSSTVSGNAGSLVKAGYVFAGWNTAADGSGTAYAESDSITMGSTDVVLYAQWEEVLTALGINMLLIISSGEVPVTCSLQGGTDNVILTQPFKMSEMEVTQKQYEAVMGRSESWTSTYGIGDNYPAYYANWWEAAEFCNRLSTLDGKTAVYYSDAGFTDVYEASDEDSIYWKSDADGFRLPTESEWEYAASGASTGSETTYAGSDTLDDVAWYSSNSESKSHEVGGKAANECGLYDMSGNLWEWTWDWYDSYNGGTDPSGASSGSYRVIRGGSWYYSASCCTVSYRGYCYPIDGYDFFGFRIVSSP